MKYESEYSSCLRGKINEASNDDLCAQRDRLIGLVNEQDLEGKAYWKVVDALSGANDMIERLIQEPK